MLISVKVPLLPQQSPTSMSQHQQMNSLMAAILIVLCYVYFSESPTLASTIPYFNVPTSTDEQFDGLIMMVFSYVCFSESHTLALTILYFNVPTSTDEQFDGCHLDGLVLSYVYFSESPTLALTIPYFNVPTSTGEQFYGLILMVLSYLMFISVKVPFVPRQSPTSMSLHQQMNSLMVLS